MVRASLLLVLLTTPLVAQDKTDDPRLVLNAFLQAKAKEHFDARRQEVAKTLTPEAIAKRQQFLKAKFIESLGGFPEKTPLNARTVGTLQGQGFKVEKVIFESRPNHHVTANLYLPEGKGPFPGVIVPCGHSVNGKAAEAYQRASILIAQNGVAALCYDPIGQGERVQFLDAEGKPAGKTSVGEHTQVGIGAWLVGTSCATYRIWDGIRSLDYLQSRPDIDPKRLGCTGNSGGGTLTSYLMALDERIWAAAPSCYLCSLEKLFATLGTQDAEQNIVGQVAFGMEHADYVTMRAPRPTIMLVGTYDYFNIDGAWNIFREAKVVYGRLGFGERVSLFEYEDKHGFSKPRREAAARWMVRWLRDKDEPIVEGNFPSFTDADLQCTRTGQVVADMKGISAFQMNVKEMEKYAGARAKFAELPEAQRQAEIRRLLNVPEKIAAAKVAGKTYEPEAGLRLTVELADDLKGETVTICVGVRPKAPGLVYADLRGSGFDSKSAASNDYKNAVLGLHLNRPLVGQRVQDILSLIQSAPLQGKKIHLWVSGDACLPALHAAALEPRIVSLRLEGMTARWDNVVRTPDGVNQIVGVIPSVLKSYDIPDLVEALAPRSVQLDSLRDARGQVMSAANAEKLFAGARGRYQKLGSIAKLVIND